MGGICKGGKVRFGQIAGLTRRDSVAASGKSAVSKRGAGHLAEAMRFK